ncbi:MAG: ATPase, T2SS/T4P/T4SS family [Coprococcus sp.]
MAILVTGPTGIRKVNYTVHSLSELNTEDVNIITVEDPVEPIMVSTRYRLTTKRI